MDEFRYFFSIFGKKLDGTMKTLLLFLSLLGQPGFQEAVLTLTGASCIEELAEDEILHYQSLAAHPVDLNHAGRGRLLATGLLSPFQVASLLDYRSRTGEILSWTELSLVDGFSPAIADALRVFAVLRMTEGTAPGQPDDRTLSASLTLRGGVRDTGETTWGVKGEAALGERAVLYGSLRTTYENPRPGAPAFSAAWYGRRALGQLIVGHFNARFGQGLVQWSGFQLSGYSTLGAFRKNGTGFSPTGSYTPSLMGVATDWNFGPWDLSVAYSLTGHQPIANLTRVWRGVTAGLTATAEAASLEARIPLPRWSLFAEAALRYRGAFSALAGAYFLPEYGRKAGLLARWYGPSDKRYSGVAAGYETAVLSLTADAGWRTDTDAAQYKIAARWHPEAEWRGLRLLPDLRVQARLRPDDKAPFRAQLRAELGLERGAWSLSGRYDALFCRAFAWNWHAELGRKTDAFAVYVRGGLFKVDNWDDRIYVYERDAPGAFTVPARYGRGWAASCYTLWHINRHHSLWLRLETVQYPWNLTEKPGRTQIRLQYRYRL